MSGCLSQRIDHYILELADTTESLFVLYADKTSEPAQGIIGRPGFYMVPSAAYEFIARAMH